MKRFLSMLATLVLVGQSVVTPAVYAMQGANENEESASETVVETTIDESDADDGSSDDEVVADVDDSTNDAEESAGLEETADAEETVEADNFETSEEPEITEDAETSDVAETEKVEEAVAEEPEVKATRVESANVVEESVSYPAVEFYGHDRPIQVNASAEEGVFPEGTTMKVSLITTSEAEDIAKQELGDAVKTAIGVDISFRDVDGNEIEPKNAQDVHISVSLINKPFVEDIKENNLTVVHQDNDGNTQSIQNVEVDKGYAQAKAEFDHNHFSIFVIAITTSDDDTETSKVTNDFIFQYFTEGERVDFNTQTLKKGDDLVNPGIPTLGANQEFLGWYYGDETPVNFTTINETLVAGKSKIIKAKIVTTYYLTYYYQGEDESVAPKIVHVDRVEVADNGSTNHTVHFDMDVEKDTQALKGWKTEDSEDLVEEVDVSRINAVYAVVVDAHWIHFYENDDSYITIELENGTTEQQKLAGGASYTAPVFVTEGKPTEKPADPTRRGYTFTGWSTKEDCSDSFEWGGTLENDLNLYACWKASDAKYSVIIRKQKVSDDKNATDDEKTYDFYKSYAFLDRKTGDPITQDMYSSYLNNNLPGFHFSHTGYDDKTVEDGNVIRAKGDTVINIYYDRDLMTIKFLYRKGNSSSYSEYLTCQGLFEQRLEKNSCTRPSDYRWSNGSTLTFLDAFIFNGLDGVSNGGKTLTLYRGDNNGNIEIRFYTQNLDGDRREAHKVQSNGGGFTITNKFAGFEAYQYRKYDFRNDYWTERNSASVGTKITDYYEAEIRFSRNKYAITFMNGGDTVDADPIFSGIYYEQPLSSYKDKAPKLGSMSGYEFKGWYEDPEGTVPFDWNSTMPAADKALYAHYASVKYRVTLDANGGEFTGGQISGFNLNYGEVIEKASLMKNVYKSGFELIGWFDKDNGMKAYDYGLVDTGVNLIAKWRNPGKVSIVYQGGDTPVDNYKYATDSSVVVGAPATKQNNTFIAWELMGADGNVEGLYYPNGSFEISPEVIQDYDSDKKEGKVVLRAKFEETGGAGSSTEKTTITYKANNGTTDEIVVSTGSDGKDLRVNQSVKALPKDTFTREGYDFIGWSTDSEATEDSDNLIAGGHEYIAADNDGENNVLYAIWKINSYKYTVHYFYDGTEDENVKVEGTGDFGSEITEVESKLKEGYKTGSVEKLPLTISSTESNNVIKVNYVKDESQTQPTKYTVKHMVGEEEKDVKEYTGTAWINDDPAMIEIVAGSLAQNRYEGYKYVSTSVAEGTTGVVNGTIITLTYEKDESQTHKASYVINFYKDGKIVEVDALSGEATGQILDVVTVKVNYTADENKYEGYKIDTGNSDTVDAEVSTTGTGDEEKVYNVRYVIKSFKVTFNSDGGSAVSGQTVKYGNTATKPADPTKKDNKFQGWNFNGKAFDFKTPITGDITLVAQWKSDGGNGGGGGGGGSTPTKYDCNTGSLPANAKDNNKTTLDGKKTEYSYGTGAGCTFQCEAGYTYNSEKNTCEKSGGNSGGGNNDEEIELGGQVSDKCSVEGFNGSEEEKAAYLYACENDITTIRDINEARLKDFLTRAEMAKMVSVFATKELGMKPNTSKDCSNFANSISHYNQEMKDYMVMSCQLELMGIHTVNYEPIPDFMPSKRVSRAEFGTVLSRVLWGNKYEGTNENYYVNHLNALKENNIITNINPHITEYRAWVFLMLYRAVEAIKVLKSTNNVAIDQQVNEELQEEGKAETGLVVEYDSGSVVPDMATVTESGTLATGAVAEVESGSVVESQTGDTVTTTGDIAKDEAEADTQSAETETGSTSD